MAILAGKPAPHENRKIVQLEVLSEIKGFQKIILEEEKAMALVLDDSKSIRFQQGLKAGIQKGVEKATAERNTAFITYLLKNTTHTNEQIAAVVNVPLQFVLDVRNALTSNPLI